MFLICSSICAQGYLEHPEWVCFSCLWANCVACHPASIWPSTRKARTMALQSWVVHVGWIVTSVSPLNPSSIPRESHAYTHTHTHTYIYIYIYIYISQLCKQSGHPDQCCRPLSAPRSLCGPCCLVLQSLQVGSMLQMAIQTNKSDKNQSLIGKWHIIVEDSKPNKHSHLVEYSWQTQCLDALRIPTTVAQDPYPLQA